MGHKITMYLSLLVMLITLYYGIDLMKKLLHLDEEKKIYKIELINGKIIKDTLYMDIGGYRNNKIFYPNNAIISVEEINY